MITTFIFDFSRVLLFPKDGSYQGKLNALHLELSRRDDYSFLDRFSFNEELLEFVSKYQFQYGFYIFTSGFIQELPEVKRRIGGLFRETFSVRELDVGKDDPEAYRIIAKEIGRKTGEILFVDDNFGNIEAAKLAGFFTILYKDNEQFFSEVGELVDILKF